jgi:hypothetical protein
MNSSLVMGYDRRIRKKALWPALRLLQSNTPGSPCLQACGMTPLAPSSSLEKGRRAMYPLSPPASEAVHAVAKRRMHTRMLKREFLFIVIVPRTGMIPNFVGKANRAR